MDENIDNSFIVSPTEENEIDFSAIENVYRRTDDFYDYIKRILRKSHCCKHGNETINTKIWETSVPWLDPKNKEDSIVAKEIYYAIYMWIGHNENIPEEKYLYIGIVGVDKVNAKNENSVWNRIFIQEKNDTIRKNNNVVIDKYRYVSLNKNSDIIKDEAKRSELLKTIEMQTINNMSALIGYKYNYAINEYIEPQIDSISMRKTDYKIFLLNIENRYHNTNSRKK